MTEHDRIVFDLKGYVIKPAVLSEGEVGELREFVLRQRREPESLPPHQRRLPGGLFERLIDHPAVMDVLLDVIDPDVAKIRLENVFLSFREGDERAWEPHAGGRTTNPNYAYNFHDGRIYAGMTRVVWELNPVEKSDGGTLFLSGAHKSSFPYPPDVLEPDNPHMESYACPAGSVILFTESLLHAATAWKNPSVERFAIFTAYNTVPSQYHRLNLAHETIAAMPPKRQTLFRGVYVHDFTIKPHEEGGNRYYSQDNRSL